MTEHVPNIKVWPEGCGIDCSCGWLDPYVWSEPVGAQSAFANHILNAVLPLDWPAFLAEEATP